MNTRNNWIVSLSELEALHSNKEGKCDEAFATIKELAKKIKDAGARLLY